MYNLLPHPDENNAVHEARQAFKEYDKEVQRLEKVFIIIGVIVVVLMIIAIGLTGYIIIRAISDFYITLWS